MKTNVSSIISLRLLELITVRCSNESQDSKGDHQTGNYLNINILKIYLTSLGSIYLPAVFCKSKGWFVENRFKKKNRFLFSNCIMSAKLPFSIKSWNTAASASCQAWLIFRATILSKTRNLGSSNRESGINSKPRAAWEYYLYHSHVRLLEVLNRWW